ncbi:class I SAM-dependent methyltransferase [Vibrio cionasavignyae]|uniref:class I SAM-dependent methyltransferase n=1 Tax=Vibrio cionasavignyae TaxID=2910252 RepID=UPI003D1378F5
MVITKIKNRFIAKFNKIIFEKFPLSVVENGEARERWLECQLKSLPDGIRILDAGAGELDKKKYCDHLEYVSQDFAQYDGVGDGNGLHMGTWDQSKIDIVCDIISMPIENDSFDAAICIEVLEHLPNPVAAITELVRILKPGGILIITAPFNSLTHFAPYHYCSGFNKYWYEEHFKKLGVSEVKISPHGNYHASVFQELGRVPSILDEYNLPPLSNVERWAQRILLSRLSKVANRDMDSHALACFGYNVVVRK